MTIWDVLQYYLLACLTICVHMCACLWELCFYIYFCLCDINMISSFPLDFCFVFHFFLYTLSFLFPSANIFLILPFLRCCRQGLRCYSSSIFYGKCCGLRFIELMTLHLLNLCPLFITPLNDQSWLISMEII